MSQKEWARFTRHCFEHGKNQMPSLPGLKTRLTIAEPRGCYPSLCAAPVAGQPNGKARAANCKRLRAPPRPPRQPGRPTARVQREKVAAGWSQKVSDKCQRGLKQFWGCQGVPGRCVHELKGLELTVCMPSPLLVHACVWVLLLRAANL